MTEADVAVALDVLQDGNVDPELLAWALVVVDAFYGGVHWISRPGSFSSTWSLQPRGDSWTVYAVPESYYLLRMRRSRRSRSRRKPVLGSIAAVSRSFSRGRSRSHSGRY